MRTMVFYPLAVLIILITTATGYAQNISWLHGSWKGKAYLLGDNASPNYDLTLTISKLKGKKFEGTMTTIQSSDPSVHFDSKISGTVNDRYLLINIDTWNVKCNSCKPQNLAFSIESGKFFFKGEAKGCSLECTWITVFSRDLMDFSITEKESLFAFADFEERPQPEELLVQNNKPLPDTVAVIQKQNSSSERVPVLPAGSIISGESNTTSTLPQKSGSSLTKNSSITIKENEAKRINILPAGTVISTENNTASTLSQNPSGALNKTTSMTIRENEARRIPVPPAGLIISTEKNTALTLSRNPTGSLDKSPSMVTKENEAKRINILPAGSVISFQHNPPSIGIQNPASLPGNLPSLAVRKNQVNVFGNTVASSKPAPPASRRDSVSLLPPGYGERKINVVRTLIVNTDSIILRVYDNGIVDGDIVSVVYNDGVIVNKLSLTAHALVIAIPVKNKLSNKLVFYAHNLGEFPPNTAKLEIRYGTRVEELTISSDYTVSSAIDIVYQK